MQDWYLVVSKGPVYCHNVTIGDRAKTLFPYALLLHPLKSSVSMRRHTQREKDTMKGGEDKETEEVW